MEFSISIQDNDRQEYSSRLG